MAELHFNKVAVLGVGLIGASFGLALKKKNLCKHITGCGRKEHNLKHAQEMGIIDSFELDPAQACADADLVLFSMPVGAFTKTARAISGSLKKDVVVTDVGSIKGKLVAEMESLMPDGVSFVAGHPIAGSDKSGIDTASADLFEGSRYIMTPTSKTDRNALKKIAELWYQLGSQITILTPEEHDKIYAAVSHMPHMLAYALVNTVAEINPSYLEFSGQGFKDTTRIALSSPELWRDICIMNRENLIELLQHLRKNIDGLEGYLKEADPDALEQAFKKARMLRGNVK